MNLLSANNLVKAYGGLRVTDNLNLAIDAGQLHAVIGPNGAGKSTLIGQLAGELSPDSGQIIFDGRDVTDKTVATRARSGLARSYQITSVFPEFSAFENVLLAVQAHRGHNFRFWVKAGDVPAIADAALEMLELTSLNDRKDVRASEMAHGELRQLELAMTLAGNPKLLLLDEPMAGMSQAESERMTELLLGLKGRYAMLLIEHDMDAVFALADRITVLVYGRAIAVGTPAEIRLDQKVRAAYLGEEADLTVDES